MPENNRPLLSELFTYGGFDPRTGIQFDGVKNKPISLSHDVSGQKRDEEGKWTKENSGTSKNRYTKFKQSLEKLNNAPVAKHIQIARRHLQKLTKQFFDKVEARYGRKVAIAVLVSGQAVGWGATGIGAVAGIPVWLPGASVWGGLPVVAVAEILRQLKRIKGTKLATEDEPSKELINKLVNELKTILQEALTEYIKDNEHTLKSQSTSSDGVDASFDTEGPGQWITIGGRPDSTTGEKHVGGFKVKITKDGTIIEGRLKGKNVKDVKAHYDRKRAKGGDDGKQQPNDRPSGTGTAQPPPKDGGQVAPTPTGPVPPTADQGGKDAREPVGATTPGRVPVTIDEANKRLDRYSDLFRKQGQHQAAEWMDKLRDHINTVGTDAALASLGEEVKGKGEQVQYTGYNIEGKNDADFIEAYLDRNGISLTPYSETGTTPSGERRAVSTVTPSSDSEGVHTRGDARDVFPILQTLRDKLDETQHLPGLERSEDLSKLLGGEFGAKVPQFTNEVLKKLDDTYGEGKWIVKSYGDEAYAGYGIFFPQRVSALTQEAQKTIWNAGENLDKYGFKIGRDPDTGKVFGLIHQSGDIYQLGTPEYDQTIQGDARFWADKAAEAAQSEHGAIIPEGKFMAGPAFPVVGISNEERAQGITFKKGQEGRVHIHTRNGKAEIIPHSTWLKQEPIPVVFESDDTRAMAQAAVDAINALPESERRGQLYAPDIVRTADGYKVVEANPANEAGASGYLQDNPLIIDSYVSHVTGREPGHVRFIRKLLSKRMRALAIALGLETTLSIGDAESPEPVPDTPPTLVSDTEILPALGAFPTEQNKHVTVDELPKKIQVTTDWGRLRAVVVGRLDNDVLPAWYPSFDNPNGNEVGGPETAGQTKEEYDPKMFKRAVKQTDALCSILESEGVKVFRPNLISPADAQADPIGLTSEWAREMFTVIGNKIVVNQPRAAHRNKDRDALTPLFLEIERAGKAQIVRPPATDWKRRDDNLEDDPRPFLEGGDVFRLGNNVLVTMSYLATSPMGYRWLADELEPDGIKVWPTYLTPKWEHGDYVFFPVREGLCVAYLKGFKDGLLPVPCQDWQVIEITHDEADKGFAANGLMLRENVMLLPKGLPRVRRALEKKGVDVIEVPFDGPMFWQGAIDCSTSELWRDG